MKKNYLGIISLLLSLCMGLGFSACSDDDDDGNKGKSIEVPSGQQLDQKVYADEDTGTSQVSFTTQAAWTSSIVETTAKSTGGATPARPDWVSISPDRGSEPGKYSISISLNPNYTGKKRTATININCGDDKIEIKVTQDEKTAEGKIPEKVDPQDEVDIYVAGYSQPQVHGKSTAMYWKNGVATVLGQYDSSASAIAVSGTDVYVAGEEKNGDIYDAVYWKNGEKMVLGDGIHNSHTHDIQIVGKDVYIVGYEVRTTENDGAYDVPKCWKNGIEVPLSLDFTKNESSDRPYSYQAVSVTSSGNDIYIAADKNLDHSLVYWKNMEEQFTPVSDKYNTIYIEGISVVGTNIYLAGSLYYNQFDVATCWKNGQEIRMENKVGYSSIDAIYATDKDVYVAGAVDAVACYWKNGVKTSYDEKDITSFSSIYVLDNNVYLCGDYEHDDQPLFTASYWINDKKYPLEKYSNANSIFVVKK